VAVALAATNVISGFMITERILRMFKKDVGGKAK
jgi:NAD/NADP transhydrogenase alpha subunit